MFGEDILHSSSSFSRLLLRALLPRKDPLDLGVAPLVLAHHVDALLGDDGLQLGDLLHRQLMLTLQLLNHLHLLVSFTFFCGKKYLISLKRKSGS